MAELVPAIHAFLSLPGSTGQSSNHRLWLMRDCWGYWIPAFAGMTPTLTQPAFITDAGMLRVTGFFPTKPEQVNFDLLFQPVGGQWRLFGISVKTRQPPHPAE
jgi:hypothetical protein